MRCALRIVRSCDLNLRLADGDPYRSLILGPHLELKSPPSIDAGSLFHAPSTGQRVSRPHHLDEAHREPSHRFRSRQPAEILAKERHAQHAVSDDAIESDHSRRLVVGMDQVVVARGAGVPDELHLGDRRLAKIREKASAIEVLVRPRREYWTSHRRMAVVVPLKTGLPDSSVPSIARIRKVISPRRPFRR